MIVERKSGISNLSESLLHKEQITNIINEMFIIIDSKMHQCKSKDNKNELELS